MAAAPDLDIRWIFHGPVVGLTRWRCSKHDPSVGQEAAEDAFVIAFPRRGVFVRHGEGRTTIADAHHAVFFNPGEPYRTSHPYGCGDHGVTVVLSGDAVRDMTSEVDSAAGDQPSDATRLFRYDSAVCDTRTFLIQKLLADAVSAEPDAFDPLEVEECALALAGRAVRNACEQHAAAPTTMRRARSALTRAAHRDAAHAVMGVLASRYGEPWTLERLAQTVHVSPFHLCRIFRAQSGVSIHRYLNEIRLRSAIERMDDDAQELSALALDSGFSSHSHFTSAFRREFGFTPLAYRRMKPAQRLDRIRTLLGQEAA